MVTKLIGTTIFIVDDDENERFVQFEVDFEIDLEKETGSFTVSIQAKSDDEFTQQVFKMLNQEFFINLLKYDVSFIWAAEYKLPYSMMQKLQN